MENAKIQMTDDAEDLAVCAKRINQAERTFESVLKDLKRDGLL